MIVYHVLTPMIELLFESGQNRRQEYSLKISFQSIQLPNGSFSWYVFKNQPIKYVYIEKMRTVSVMCIQSTNE